MDWSEWRQLFPDRMVRRGLDYYEKGLVGQLEQDGDAVRALVRGTRDYQVELALEGTLIADWRCTCPYGGDGTPCKHLAAVFFALERGKASERIRPLEALVAGLTARQAKTLLLRLARQTQATGQLREMIRQLPESGEKS